MNLPLYKIYYNSDKGSCLKSILSDYPNINNVIFVDDLQSNIDDVYDQLKDIIKIQCYLYNKQII